jgi:polyphosphate kinase
MPFITRNSDLYVDEEEAENLLRSINRSCGGRAGAMPSALKWKQIA